MAASVSAAVEFERVFAFQTAGADVRALLEDLITRLSGPLGLRREESSPAMDSPAQDLLPGYLVGIEQALAIALAARQAGGESFLHQERAIFDHLFDVALQSDRLLRPRLLLVNALENEARRRPDIVREYLGKLALLQQRHASAEGVGNDLVAKGVAAVREKANADQAL